MKKGTEQATKMVLVVEDDQAVRRMLRFSLRRAGFEIRETASVSEALHLLEEQPPQAVILDLGLPDGRGDTVLTWLKAHDQSETGNPVWLVISAQDVEEVNRRVGPLHEHFFPKPFDPWQLVESLERLLQAQRQAL